MENSEKEHPVRTLGPTVLLFILTVDSFAAHVNRASSAPQPSILLLLGGGLVGLATVIRRRFSE